MKGRHDVAVMVLEHDARDAVPEVISIPFNCETLDEQQMIVEMIQTVGYDCIDSFCYEENTSQLWAVQETVDMNLHSIEIDGYGTGVCFGDSGGPIHWTMPSGEVRVLGTLHGVIGTAETGISFRARQTTAITSAALSLTATMRQ